MILRNVIVGLLLFVTIPVNASEKTLRVLTDRTDFHLTKIIENFENKTDIDVIFQSVDDDSLDQKIKTGKFDIVISRNSSTIVNLKDHLFFYRMPESVVRKVPAAYIDTNHFQWVLLSYRIRAFHIRKGLKEYPTSYAELADSKYWNSICVRDFTHDYNLEMFGTLLKSMGYDGFTSWFDAFKLNIARHPTGNDRNQIKGVYNGVCDIAIANTYYRSMLEDNPQQQSWAKETFLIIPDQKKYEKGAIGLFSAAAIVSNNELSEYFLLYLLSDEVQKFISKNNYEYPLDPDNTAIRVKKYGKTQGLDYKSMKLHQNIQSEMSEYKNQAYIIIKHIRYDIAP